MAAIRTEGLTKRFGALTALDDLTLEVAEGEVFGFLGPNGAGKSTTLRILLGLIRATAGEAWVMEVDVHRVEEAHRHLAYVPGDVSLWPKLTGAECLELLANLHGGTDRGMQASLIERFALDPTKRARTYSKGNRQKVALIAAFSTRADVLLLDEPTSGLDPLMEKEFRRCVEEASERGQTVFLSSHILTEVERLCDRVGILRDGHLVEVATIDKLLGLHTSDLEVDVEGDRSAIADELRSIPGVGAVHVTPTGLRLALGGPPGPLLAALGALPVTALRAEEPSLEEIFLTYYGDRAAAGDRTHDGDG